MDELIEEFLVETKEGLEELDNDLVSLEQDPNDKEIISKIFRCMHTIKGTCGFLGLSKLESVAHAGEDVFDLIRNDKLVITPEIISILFEALDKISAIVEHIEENETEPDEDYTPLITKLRGYASGTTEAQSPSEQPQTTEAAPEATTEAQNPAQPAQEQTTKEEPPATPTSSDESQIGDSDELQALFDATEPLVDMDSTPITNTEATKEENQGAAAPSEPENAESQIGDSDELQALFDATESLVDMGPAPAATEESTKTEPAKAKEEPKTPEKAKEKKAPAAQTIRVNLEVLEGLMQYASELVLTRNQLMQILRKKQDSEFGSALQRLNNITTGLQESVMQTRMQPVGNAWTKLPRIVRDLATELDKKIELKMVGEETELDRQLLEMITDPLTHMVRNSADHGLESTEKRIAAGKPEKGTIELKAYHGGGYIIIEISDDGGGIDPEVIKSKAIANGLTTDHESMEMSDSQILQFIFMPGFSTAEQVTSVSGRGVGMDVVKNNIEKIRGVIDLKSEIGKGSVFTIKIPLTLAIMSILQVAVNGQKFAIPQINVIEIVKANSSSGFMIEKISDRPVLRIRDKLLPLISLSEALGLRKPVEDTTDDSTKKSEFIVVCEVGNYHYGIIVEEIFDTEEIVLKPVSPMLKSIDVYSGSTILGDGSVILILDPNGLAKTAGEIPTGSERQIKSKQEEEEGELASFIVFKAGDATPKVAPLEIISRLEEIDVSKIEYSGGWPVLQYRGDLMKIMFVDDNYKLPEEGIVELLVLSGNDKIMGLAVDEIVDLAKCHMHKELEGGRDGFLGSMVINEKTCDVIDISYYFKKAFGPASSNNEQKRGLMLKQENDKKVVMLVDDSPFFRKFIPPEIQNGGYEVIVCSSAKEAMNILENGTSVTAVVSDIHMPEMDGHEFISACREDERFASIPFIALSSHAEEDNENGDKTFEKFDAFVSKTNHEELVEVLNKVCNKEVIA